MVLMQSGADIDVIRAMLKNKHPARSICSDKTLGADKLAYTLMDAAKCEFYQLPPNHELILPFLNFYSAHGLCVDLHNSANHIRPIDFICTLQEFYFKMYTEVYLSEKSLVYERHIQRAVEHTINAGILKPETVWNLPDDVLVRTILENKKKSGEAALAKLHMTKFTSKKPYCPAVAFKYEKYKNDYIEGEDVFHVDREFVDNFLNHFFNPVELTKLECMLEGEFNIPMLCCLLPDSAKLKPQDVAFMDQGTCKTTLFEERPYHHKHLLETADAFFTIRLLVPKEDYREAKKLSKSIDVAAREFIGDLTR